eukprot:3023856-Rhodomonas_salina.2
MLCSSSTEARASTQCAAQASCTLTRNLPVPQCLETCGHRFCSAAAVHRGMLTDKTVTGMLTDKTGTATAGSDPHPAGRQRSQCQWARSS